MSSLSEKMLTVHMKCQYFFLGNYKMGQVMGKSCYTYGNSKGLGKPVHPCSLARTFAVHSNDRSRGNFSKRTTVNSRYLES